MSCSSFKPIVASISLALILFALSDAQVCAQEQSTDGATPLALQPGAPAGSYPLSDFDNVNLFNGSLNFSLSLVRVGGRGGLGYPITLRLDQKWLVDKEPTEGQPPINMYYPQPSWWTDWGFAPMFSMGRLEGRQAGTRTYDLVSPCGYIHHQTLTRLTFTAPDGTEYELRDQQSKGQPANASCTPYDRGTVFITADGTGATFISDNNIVDYPYDNPGDMALFGNLVLKDGTRYRIDNNNVTWMRDRNGNKLVFTYDNFHRMTAVTDSLNRQVTISYGGGAGTYDQITYKGYQGAVRTIKVHYASISSVLRSDFTFQTLHELFPDLNGAGSYYDPAVVSAVELPNGKQYQFRYNGYIELSRIILPTGGAIEYDYAAGLTDSGISGVLTPATAQRAIYRRVVERRIYPDGGTGTGYTSRMTYSRPESSTTNAGYVDVDQYNATGSLLGRTRHYFYGSARQSFSKQPTEYPAWTDGKEYKTEAFDTNGFTLMRSNVTNFEQRTAVTWWTGGSATAPPNDVRPYESLTTLGDTNQISKQAFEYDDSVPFNNQNKVKEYDFGSGAPGILLRETRTTYVTSSSYTGTNVYLRSLPQQISVWDGNTIERARTTFEYDNYTMDGTDCAHSLHCGLTSRSSVSGFDSSFDTGYTTRGNRTATTQYFLVNGSVTGSVSSYSQYDVLGNTVRLLDPRSTLSNIIGTTLEYDDRFGAPDGEARGNTLPTELAGLTSFSYPTKITNAAGHITYAQLDYYLGQAVDAEDANGILASGYFVDALDRPTQIRRAIGTSAANQTTFTYDDTNRVITTTRDLNANSDNIIVSKLLYDPMGQTIETRQYEDATNYIAVQTQYDVLGRAYKTSNPFRPLQLEGAIWTKQLFDALGRIVSVTTPDSAAIITSYSGNSVTVSDQTGKQRKSVTDGLGRLVQAYEAPNDTNYNYLTSYTYDTLDSMTGVSQGFQSRSFVYDSLKRLTSAANPESGTINYQYDNAGNLLVKTDARGVSAHFAYDSLNRIVRRWYNSSNSDSSTINNNPQLPSTVGASDAANFYYDNQTLPAGAPSFSRGASLGRMVAVTYGANTSTTGDYSGYDDTGRNTLKIQRTGNTDYQLSATYNVANLPTTVTYPSGHSVSYTYDAASRALTFTGTLGDGSSRNYSTEALYSPLGGLTKEKFGTTPAVYNKLFYNSRGQLSEIRESTSWTGPTDTTWNRGAIVNHYSDNCSGMCGGSNSTTAMTDNNGNLRKQEIYIPNDEQLPTNNYNMRSQQYDYDPLNRLNWARETTGGTELWRQWFHYDRYGNRTIDNTQDQGDPHPRTYGTGINNKAFTVALCNSVSDPCTNQLGVPSGESGTMHYDAAGNLDNDTYTGAGTRTYDAENKITSAVGGIQSSGSQLYKYDASGQRIKRTVDGTETWAVYGFGGEMVAEYAANGVATTPQKEYGYRNGQLLVTATPPPTVRQNFALRANGGAASASSEISGGCDTWPARGVIDGDRKGSYWGNNGGWADSSSGNFTNDWLQVDFDAAKTIDELDIVTLQDNYANPSEPTEAMTFSTYGLTAYSVSYWNGSAWISIPEATVVGNNKVWRKFTFSPITTTRIRVLPQAAVDNGNSRLTEVEAWGTATAPAKTNVALRAQGAVATASSEISAGCDTWPARGANDGDRKGAYWGGTGGWADSSAGNFTNDWLQIDFSGNKTINEIDVFTLQDNYANPVEPTESTTFSSYGLTAFDVSYWNGTSWVQIPETVVTGNNKVWRKFTFSAITTSKIRVYGRGAIDNGLSRLAEVEAWSPTESSAGGGMQWLITDQLGTPRMVLDESGALANVKRHDYLPFGEELQAGMGGRTTAQGYGGGDGIRQQFTRKERDLETGLDYFGARYYASTQGRFTSVDPLMASGMAVDPQSWNRYAHAANNPLRYTDDDGLLKRDETGNLKFDVDIELTRINLSRVRPDDPKARNSGYTGEWGYLYTDKGTPIQAFRSNDRDPSADCNCHGLSFGDGRFFIDNTQVQTILDDDYDKTNEPQVGDIAVYTEPGKGIQHTATVVGFDDQGKVVLVAGLGGISVRSQVTTASAQWPAPKTRVQFYTSKKPDSEEQRAARAAAVSSFNKIQQRARRDQGRRIEREVGRPPKVPKLKKPPKESVAPN